MSVVFAASFSSVLVTLSSPTFCCLLCRLRFLLVSLLALSEEVGSVTSVSLGLPSLVEDSSATTWCLLARPRFLVASVLAFSEELALVTSASLLSAFLVAGSSAAESFVAEATPLFCLLFRTGFFLSPVAPATEVLSAPAGSPVLAISDPPVLDEDSSTKLLCLLCRPRFLPAPLAETDVLVAMATSLSTCVASVASSKIADSSTADCSLLGRFLVTLLAPTGNCVSRATGSHVSVVSGGLLSIAT
mmetsp:Transcript_1693/g.2853  ORF Transcript_1693/g.2853 Transcript_1693/m.2853 type:complete len:246 (+) Transcript_1693:643-1380(+)